jgi:hypothetical protein
MCYPLAAVSYRLVTISLTISSTCRIKGGS